MMRKLSIKGKDVVLGFQHMFAMLGATITVPIVAGMEITTTTWASKKEVKTIDDVRKVLYPTV